MIYIEDDEYILREIWLTQTIRKLVDHKLTSTLVESKKVLFFNDVYE